ncbi:hypothetical protein LCL89_02385 [Halobacillus yeomjeoni]|uniref:hypothetical protein n=1 Tax=Halobacillus yeomjeoni TaxID=311194 RepID=UPI001CD735C1|nr:hypothetical protein [Halobacillus yeomjeoni]MCA0982888.1 hypothetical protein [Halobacillus yeomjeoni]
MVNNLRSFHLVFEIQFKKEGMHVAVFTFAMIFAVILLASMAKTIKDRQKK